MFYPLLRQYARLIFPLIFRRIKVEGGEAMQLKGPVLFAANHPNSFLDGIILSTLMDKPLYSLARGDAFQAPWANRLLRSLRLLPVYRTSEGVENLEHNYTTFAACIEVFKKDKAVLIFSEGRCINEWHLRPLKKGTARLATTAWKNGLPLQVIPLAFNYSSFRAFPKEVHLSFGRPINAGAVMQETTEGRQWAVFNEALRQQLSQRVYEIGADDKKARKKIFGFGWQAKLLPLLPFALAGTLLHFPLFLLAKGITHYLFPRNDHYDSILYSLLMLLYPVYFCVLLLAGWLLGGWGGLLLAILSPLLARAALLVNYVLKGG